MPLTRRIRFVPRRFLGTKRSDVRVGNGFGNVFVTLAGNDRVACAGRDRDYVNAGTGNDVVRCIDVRATRLTRDTVLCGLGRDTAYVDKFDVTRGCERVIRR